MIQIENRVTVTHWQVDSDSPADLEDHQTRPITDDHPFAVTINLHPRLSEYYGPPMVRCTTTWCRSDEPRRTFGFADQGPDLRDPTARSPAFASDCNVLGRDSLLQSELQVTAVQSIIKYGFR